jgi:hypothetical protein
VIALEAGAMILGLVAIALIILLDDPEDAGRVTRGWRARHDEGRDQR